MKYTGIVDGIQIMDVTYVGLPPKNTPPTFEIAKHADCEPQEVIDLFTGEKRISTHYVFAIGYLEWNSHERWWNLRSVGTRLIDYIPSAAAVEMIQKFAHEKASEMRDEEDDRK